MIARIQKRMEEKEQGFTLIELLVVMIIIGILAAIAIPIFLSQREKAEDSAAKADVSTLGKEIATYYVDNTGTPAVSVDAGTGKYMVDGNTAGNPSNNVELGDAVENPGATTWCIDVTNDEGDVAATTGGGGYKYSAAGGLEEGPCA